MAGGRARSLVSVVAVVMALVASLVWFGTSTTASAGATPVPGTGAPHPRLVYSPGAEAVLRDRLTREPYRRVFRQMSQRANTYNGRPLGDMSIGAQRDLSRAAKTYAFQYALDRTLNGSDIVPFADAAVRQAVGDRVEALLLNLFPRSRLAVPAPIGGWDRDISTAEEIANYSAAFDTMLGAGYDFGAARQTIVDRLASVTGELYDNFRDPSTVGNVTDLHQNNHRTKSGAAMALAAITLADEVPEAADWFDFGVLLVDDSLRYILVTGDGAYSEGPLYYRLTMQNVWPLLSAWQRLLGDQPWTVDDLTVPALHDHPLYRRTQKWMLDVTLPDGTMAPIDDSNPGRSMYFGALPSTLPEAAAAYWRWADTPQPFETDGSVEMGPDTIVAYDDAITPREPWWSPTQFYVEGGTASLRSDWSSDGVMALVLGEHDTASEFGRDRLGVGRAPQSHEHAEGGSFMMNAFGERLALDPGYLTFATHGVVNQPQHHNMVLVDGAGPADYLAASFDWLDDPLGRPPAEGQATLYDTLDGAGLDTTSVATWYRDTEVTRRFVLADDRYLVIGDTIRGSGGSLTWMQHGNGGGTSGGTYTSSTNGGRWEVGGARLDTAITVADQSVAFDTIDAAHEVPYTQQRSHTALRATVPSGSADALQVFYPSPIGAAPPVTTPIDQAGRAGIDLVDAGEDRHVVAVRDASATGVRVTDTRLDGSLRVMLADGATELVHDGVALVRTTSPGSLGLRKSDGQADVVAQTSDATVTVGDLGFVPAGVDGACGFSRSGGTTTVRLNRERRFTLRAAGGNARPAADAGRGTRVTPGTVVTLDGTASCDADGDALRATWELVSAPAGSEWRLSGTDSMHPQLTTDEVGPYRVRLTVTDTRGLTSLEQEVLVIAGDRCADGIDNDTDGRIDTDDPNCDGTDPVDPVLPVEPEETTTTTTVAPAASVDGAGASTTVIAATLPEVVVAPRFTG